MKTTLNIDDKVMADLKREAARQGRTMSELVETALRPCCSPNADGKKSSRFQPSTAVGSLSILPTGMRFMTRWKIVSE
jgi:hypothetical protein